MRLVAIINYVYVHTSMLWPKQCDKLFCVIKALCIEFYLCLVLSLYFDVDLSKQRSPSLFPFFRFAWSMLFEETVNIVSGTHIIKLTCFEIM